MTWRLAVLGAALLLSVQALVLALFGQPLACTCGYIKLWEGVVNSIGNSQHIADWYSLSHIIHGLIFYGVLTWLMPRSSLATRLLLAVGIESAWEMAENTPMVIEHYRLQALANGYSGDSVLNSVCDTVMMIVGFAFARLAPWWASVALGLGLEGVALWSIRDGLSLNILGFFWQPDFISRWQQGS